jgi:tripartite-type tricarboxylate transporter receptor subunit TctC
VPTTTSTPPADGYTLLLAISSGAINATLYSNLSFSFVHDIAPVAMIGLGPFVMVINPKLPTQTVPEFIAYAKANPGKINMASQGTGLACHLMGELFKMMAGVNLVHVPYRDNFTADLIGGQVQVAFVPITNVIEFIRDGRLRPLAVTTAKRSELLPGFCRAMMQPVGMALARPRRRLSQSSKSSTKRSTTLSVIPA